MIKAHCYTKEWINGFKQQRHLKRINPPILEKMIHAFSLLQQLKAHGLISLLKVERALCYCLPKQDDFR